MNIQEKYYGLIFEKKVVFHQGARMTQQGELKMYVCTHCLKAIGKNFDQYTRITARSFFVTFSK